MINGYIYILGGKNMHYIDIKDCNKVSTLQYDIDIGEFGAFYLSQFVKMY